MVTSDLRPSEFICGFQFLARGLRVVVGDQCSVDGWEIELRVMPDMDLADFIKFGAAEPALRSLVIGGYAVAAHGHTRPTFDVDLMVRSQDAPEWHRRARAAGLSTVGESKAFIQYSQPQGGDGLDLMLVSDETFEQMWSASEEKDLGYGRARVPCLDHLLALKLHALKQGLLHRTSKDAEDVEILVRRNRVDLKDARYELLFHKYGSREIYDTFLRILGNS